MRSFNTEKWKFKSIHYRKLSTRYPGDHAEWIETGAHKASPYNEVSRPFPTARCGLSGQCSSSLTYRILQVSLTTSNMKGTYRVRSLGMWWKLESGMRVMLLLLRVLQRERKERENHYESLKPERSRAVPAAKQTMSTPAGLLTADVIPVQQHQHHAHLLPCVPPAELLLWSSYPEGLVVNAPRQTGYTVAPRTLECLSHAKLTICLTALLSRLFLFNRLNIAGAVERSEFSELTPRCCKLASEIRKHEYALEHPYWHSRSKLSCAQPVQ